MTGDHRRAKQASRHFAKTDAKWWLYALAALLAFVSAPHEATAQQQCTLGSTVTVRLKLRQPIRSVSDEWLAIGWGATPCFVDTLVGKGRVPAACAVGKTLEATGIVKMGEDGALGVILEVSSAQCK